MAAGCDSVERGPIEISAIGGPPALVNPNRDPISPASALLLEVTAQGLVRFDAAGEIEPALAQSWIVSDDGRRYTFRLRRTTWANGAPVTARQVVERLQATLARASRNPLKPVLGSIEEIEAMTEQVLEIRLRSPRAHFLQLLAQPEMAVLHEGQGTGPYRIVGDVEGALRLAPPEPDEDAVARSRPPDILLRADSPATAIVRFELGRADLVTGGTIGDLPLITAAEPPQDRLIFDPAAGMFGLAFTSIEGGLGDSALRHALSMAIDRQAILARFNLPLIAARTSIVAPGVDALPDIAQPYWAGAEMEARRVRAAAIVSDLTQGQPLRLRIAVPDGPGYRIVFAHIRRDWRLIGVEAVRVSPGDQAELRMIDLVAPAELASWYLRPFICGQSAVCDTGASEALEAARQTLNPGERQALLAQADRALTDIAAFVPIAAPVRWSLRSGRLNAFRVNAFARHNPTELIERRN